MNSTHTNQHAKSYYFESLGGKQRMTFDIILDHYRSGVDLLHMIIQRTIGTRKYYLIGASKNVMQPDHKIEKNIDQRNEN